MRARTRYHAFRQSDRHASPFSSTGMSCRAPIALLAVYLCGCSSTHLALEDKTAAQPLKDDAERYIVAGVENDDAIPIAHAGSTPRGYDSPQVYGPTLRTKQLLKGLEHDYGLREITAWPIATLHMQCAVLELRAGADRASVLAAISRDPRVRIAQPLQKFTTQVGGLPLARFPNNAHAGTTGAKRK